MRWHKLILLSILSGLLLAFSWYPHGFPLLIFVAFVPLFILSEALTHKNGKLPFLKALGYSLPAFVVWNAITTYWISYCTVPGGIGAVVINALLQSLVFALWHSCRTHIPQRWTHPILFIALWMSFEYLHLNWDLTWPWLNLGNVFAVWPRCIQWYSVTGTFGGTLWVLGCNTLFYLMLRHESECRARAWGQAAAFMACLVVPIVISLCMYSQAERNIDKSTPMKVLVVQPNTDVWNEQFRLTNQQQAQRIIDMITPYCDSQTCLAVCPESCIPHTVSLEALKENTYPTDNPTYGCFPLFDKMTDTFPNLNLILGLSTYRLFDHPVTITVQQIGKDQYIDLYNTAVCYNHNRYNGYYHKSKLVPGVEALPFPKVFGFLSDLLVDLGGSHGSLGKDTKRRVFPITVNGKPVKTSTAICYESIYGEHVSSFVKNGSNVLTVITNDSWWNDSPGHVQHFEMARLRAIENHRYVLRSANGGFSGIIDPMGNVMQKTRYLERKVLVDTVYAQQDTTFYTRHGDYLAMIAVILTIAGLAYTLFCIIKHLILKTKI